MLEDQPATVFCFNTELSRRFGVMKQACKHGASLINRSLKSTNRQKPEEHFFSPICCCKASVRKTKTVRTINSFCLVLIWFSGNQKIKLIDGAEVGKEAKTVLTLLEPSELQQNLYRAETRGQRGSCWWWNWESILVYVFSVSQSSSTSSRPRSGRVPTEMLQIRPRLRKATENLHLPWNLSRR